MGLLRKPKRAPLAGAFVYIHPKGWQPFDKPKSKHTVTKGKRTMPKQWHVNSLSEMDDKDASEVVVGDTVHYTDHDGNRVVAECVAVDGESGAVQWKEIETEVREESDDGSGFDWF